MSFTPSDSVTKRRFSSKCCSPKAARRNVRKRATMSSSNQSPSTIGMTLSASGANVGARHLGEVVLHRRALVGEDQPRLVKAVAAEHAANRVRDQVLASQSDAHNCVIASALFRRRRRTRVPQPARPVSATSCSTSLATSDRALGDEQLFSPQLAWCDSNAVSAHTSIRRRRTLYRRRTSVQRADERANSQTSRSDPSRAATARSARELHVETEPRRSATSDRQESAHLPICTWNGREPAPRAVSPRASNSRTRPASIGCVVREDRHTCNVVDEAGRVDSGRLERPT